MVHRKALLLFSILDFSDMILGTLALCQNDLTNQPGVQAKAKVAYLVLEMWKEVEEEDAQKVGLKAIKERPQKTNIATGETSQAITS